MSGGPPHFASACRRIFTMSTEIIIADDQELVRLGFRMVINAQPDLKVTGEVGNGAQAITAARVLRPDVMLIDIRMPDVDGLQAARQIMREGSAAKIILITTFDLDDYVEAGLRAGVRGFLLKDTTPPQLLAAIRAVKAGELVLPEAAAGQSA
jgi:DNA-binding NarL/FixJ family response regulator